MRNSDDPKGQYLDTSYGWQDRGDMRRIRDRRRRRRWLIVAALGALSALIYLFWR